MDMQTISLQTGDGPCSVACFRPEQPGVYPGVVFLIDGFGPRAALFDMAARIAKSGYVVALPDLFHRVGSVLDLLPPGNSPRDVKTLIPMVLGVPEVRTRWRERFFASASNPAHLETDLGPVLDSLSTRADVRPGALGAVGYCLGGNLVLRAAAIFGRRLGAVASFHGSLLATDAEDSPHLGASQIAARVLVRAASEDVMFSDAMKSRLAAALTAAGVTYSIETYPARHGFCVPDLPTYDPVCAERHYAELRALFDSAL